MSSSTRLDRWLGRNKVGVIVGGGLLFFVMAPFPLGCGVGIRARDELRGHPLRAHGSQPQKFVGLWVRDEAMKNDFLGTALYLMPDGLFAGVPEMARRRWHYDGDLLYIDYVSRCGNCYAGNITHEYSASFAGADKLVVTNADAHVKRASASTFRRVQISDLKAEARRLDESADEEERYRARKVLQVIEHVEALTKFRSKPAR